MEKSNFRAEHDISITQSFSDVKTVKANRVIGGSVEISLADAPDMVYFREQGAQYSNPIYINTSNGQNNLDIDNREITQLSTQILNVNEINNYQNKTIIFANENHNFDIFGMTDMLQNGMAANTSNILELQHRADIDEAQIGDLQAQMNSTGVKPNNVASGLQTQLSDQNAMIETNAFQILLTQQNQRTDEAAIAVLQGQMASTQAAPIDSGLQQQINELYTRLMSPYAPGQVITMLRTDQTITVGNSLLIKMDGTAAFNRTQNPELWDLLGLSVQYPSGFGYMPNWGNRFLIGSDDDMNLGKTVGANSVNLTTSQLPVHSHSISYGQNTGNIYGAYIPPNNTSYYGGVSSSNATVGGTTMETGQGQAIQITPASYKVNYYCCVK